jgi:hypothetical protein
MMSDTRWRRTAVFGFLLGAAAMVGLVVLWHAAGFASTPRTAGQDDMTGLLTQTFGWGFILAYALAALLVGFMIRNPLATAGGMILPFPVALAIDITQRPTSHNLFPFEIALMWIPAFILALFFAWLGTRARESRRRILRTAGEA